MIEDPNPAAELVPGADDDNAKQVIDDTPTPPVVSDPVATAVGVSVRCLHEDIDNIEGGLTFELKKAKQMIDEAIDWVRKHFERTAPAVDEASVVALED